LKIIILRVYPLKSREDQIIFISISPFSSLNKIIQVQRKIAESPAGSVNLSSLAEMTGYSPSCLSHNFKRLSGISLQSYLVKMKCCSTLWQILASGKPIKTIALEAGYKPLYFSKLFNRIFGLPPSSLRKLPY
jgi:AraC-like DNA-binding protein